MIFSKNTKLYETFLNEIIVVLIKPVLKLRFVVKK